MQAQAFGEDAFEVDRLFDGFHEMEIPAGRHIWVVEFGIEKKGLEFVLEFFSFGVEDSIFPNDTENRHVMLSSESKEF